LFGFYFFVKKAFFLLTPFLIVKGWAMDLPQEDPQPCARGYNIFRSCMSSVNHLKRRLSLESSEDQPAFLVNQPHGWARTYVKPKPLFKDGPVKSGQVVSQIFGQDFMAKQEARPVLKDVRFVVIGKNLQTGGTVLWNPNIQNCGGELTHPSSSASQVGDGLKRSRRVKSSAAISSDDTHSKTSANHPNIIDPSSQTKNRLTKKMINKGKKLFRQEQAGDRSR
jgi:hypothetical protein